MGVTPQPAACDLGSEGWAKGIGATLNLQDCRCAFSMGTGLHMIDFKMMLVSMHHNSRRNSYTNDKNNDEHT